MKLLFKQQPSFIFRFYVTNQDNELLYIIKRKMAIMYQLYIYDAHENIVARIEEDPRSAAFFVYKNEKYIGAIEKEFSYFIPYFLVDYRKWNISGEYIEYNYEVKDENNYLVGRIEKRSWNILDTCDISVDSKEDSLDVVILTTVIDIEKARRNRHY